MRKILWDFLHELVTSPQSDWAVANFQRICGLGKDNERNIFFDTYFRVSSACGDEIFNLIPLLFWLFPEISLAYITNFGFTLTLGQVVKDIVKLPRPHGKNSSHKIFKLEAHYGTEFGLPSTHTMAGFLPMSIALRLQQRGVEVPIAAWAGCLLYIVSVALSRLYMGVHSVLDLVSGAILACLSLWLIDKGGDDLDDFLYGRPESVFAWIFLVFIFMVHYPSTRPWSASTSTACQIFGLCSGLGSAAWFAQVECPQYWHTILRHSILRVQKEDGLGFDSGTFILLRVLSATIAVLAVKAVSKKIALAVFIPLFQQISLSHYDPLLMRDSEGNSVPIEKMYPVEIPVRFISYGLTAWTAVVCTPAMWEFLGLTDK